MSQRYVLTLTDEQLRVIDRACDVYSRLHSGQFDVITGNVMAFNPNAPDETDRERYARRDTLADCLRALEPLMTRLEPNAFHSIGSEAISDNARVAYDVMKVIRYLRFVEGGSKQPNVYGYPPRQMSQEPLPALWQENDKGEGEADPQAQQALVDAALAVARLNLDKSDSIRPMTNGATKAFHLLEDAYRAYTGQPPIPKEGGYEEKDEL